MSGASERRQKRAEAKGFSSYSQEYRASKVGYVAQGDAYNSAMEAGKTGRVIKRRTARGGVVISAERNDFKALMRAVRREMD